MFLRVSTTRDGIKYAHIVEAFRDENGKSRQRVIEAHGKLDDLLKDNPNAVEDLRARAKHLTAEKSITHGRLDFDTETPSTTQHPLNVGWLLVDAILHRLGATQLLTQAGKEGNWKIDAAQVLRMLVASRVIWPGSKKAAWENHDRMLLGGTTTSLDHVYQALDRISTNALALQQRANTSLKRTRESLSTVDYDVTNYFFHIDQADENPGGKRAARAAATRQKGVSKEHRMDPIIQMGLFCDNQGLPMCYRLFDGNTPDVATLPGALEEFKSAFTPGRVVVVADKAMNTKNNLGALFQNSDGWIVSESTRKMTAELRTWLLDESGWVWNQDHTVKHKSLPVTRSVPVAKYGVDNLPLLTQEKIVATWSLARFERDRYTREEVLTRARALVDNEVAYRAGNKRGARKYVTSETVDPHTGELLTGRDSVLGLDQDKIDADAQLDGYYLLRTSETAAPDVDIIARYHQLVQIEDAFRVTKTDLSARPVYVRTPAHIEAHFAVCFLALLITRLLTRWTGLPSGQVLDGIRGMVALPVGDGIYRLARPRVWDRIDQATEVGLDHDWVSLAQLRSWQRDLTQTMKTVPFTTRKTL